MLCSYSYTAISLFVKAMHAVTKVIFYDMGMHFKVNEKGDWLLLHGLVYKPIK